MKHINALVAVALLIGGGNVQAGLINPGFESGLSSWNTDISSGNRTIPNSQNPFNTANPGVVMSNISGKNPSLGLPPPPTTTYGPTEADHFLMIGSGNAAAIDDNPPGTWQRVYQVFDIAAGETLSGYAAFDWDDAFPQSDGAIVRIFGSINGTTYDDTVFEMNGDSYLPSPPAAPNTYIPDYYNGPWTLWNWIAPAATTLTEKFTIEYAVANTVNNRNNSYGYFDTVPPARVPEPATLALFVIGLASLNIARRRKTFSTAV